MRRRLSYSFLQIFVLIFSAAFVLFLSSCISPRPQSEVTPRNVAQLQAPVESEDLSTVDPREVSESESPNRTTDFPNSYFEWPVDEARLTRGYFLKDPRGKRKRPHLGVDLAAPRGTPIYASHDGLVIYVGRQFKGYGRMIMVEGKNGWATLYAHLTKARVKEGWEIRQGDLIGDMGRTGRATGVHLHFEIRKLSGPIDPLSLLPHSPRFAGMKAPFAEEDERSLLLEDQAAAGTLAN